MALCSFLQHLDNTDRHCKAVFLQMKDHLRSAITRLKDGECAGENPSFNLEDFWTSLKVSSSSLSSEVTKLCMIASDTQPHVRQLIALLENIEALYDNMLKNFYELPKEKGLVLRKKVQGALEKLLKSLWSLYCSLESKQLQLEKEHPQLAGYVWESCEAIELLPHNNLDAVCEEFDEQLTLVEDALQEFTEETLAHEETIENITPSDPDDNRWSNEDIELLPHCMALVKTARASMRRIKKIIHARDRGTSEEDIPQLDEFMKAANRLSPAVDDFVSASYPPIEKQLLQNSAVELVNAMKEVLMAVKENNYIQEEDRSWVDFLLKAVNHNNDKLQPLLM